MESLWKRLLKLPGLRCWVAAHTQYGVETTAFLRARGVPASAILLLNSPTSLKCVDLFFRTTGGTTPDCACERVQIFHGLAGWGCAKSGGVDPQMDSLTSFNRLFMTGPNQEKILREQYFTLHPEIRERTALYKIGSPKSDALFDGTYSRDSVIKRYNLDPQKPIILYAPTWEKEASLHTYGDDILTGLAGLNASVLIKPHPNFLAKNWPRPDRKPWSQVLADFCRQHLHCRLVTDPNSNLYLVATDVLITDASGVGLEYLLLNKPIIYYDCPAYFAIHGANGIEYWGRSAGEIAATAAELGAAVQHALTDPIRLAPAREQVINQLVFNRGCATEAAVRAVHDILGLPQ